MSADSGQDVGPSGFESKDLTGGVNHVRRVGNTIVRPASPNSATIHRLLRHLDAVGFRGSPRPLALDTQHETLTFVPGEVTDYPLTANFRTDLAVTSAARLLRRLHDASASFQTGADDVWFRPSEQPDEVVCHGDFAPYNCCVENGKVVGVFDFDTAHWGPRLSDVGYAAYRWVPLTSPHNDDGFGTLDQQRRRLHLFCAAYGTELTQTDLIQTDLIREVLAAAQHELRTLVDTMHRLANDGNTAFARHIAAGHDQLYLSDIDYIGSNEATLAAMPPTDLPAT